MQRIARTVVSFALALSASITVARAQCATWVPGYAPAGCDGLVGAFAAYDGGSGPALYAGGGFYHAGPLTTSFLARWTGTGWSALPQTPDSDVYDMVVHDDGSGPSLFVVGHFTHVGSLSVNHSARWNGTSWSALGAGTAFEPSTLAVYDDGSGPALYAGGYSPTGSTLNSYVARWNGTTWSDVGLGIDGNVWALAVHDDGSGPALYAGGDFAHAGGAPATRLAKWNGTSWSGFAASPNGSVHALASFDDGAGAALYVGGAFSQIGATTARGIASWRASAWSEVGGGLVAGGTERNVYDLHVHDDGSGPALYATGAFSAAGAVAASNVARWDGSAWSALGVGIGGATDSGFALASFDEGAGARLFVGGMYTTLADGSVANAIVRWNGASLSTLGATNVPNGQVFAFQSFDDGSGPKLYLGGSFTAAGDVLARRVASFDGTTWAALGSGVDGPVSSLAVHDDGGGNALYVGGRLTQAGGAPAMRVAKWNGAFWQGLGAGPGLDEVYALASYDSGSGAQLYAAGREFSGFQTCVRRWNGSSWSSVGCFTPLPFTGQPVVSDLAVYDFGNGPRLAATGRFHSSTTGALLANVATFDGASWFGMGSGLTSPPFQGVDPSGGSSIAIFDDGTGPAVYVGGYFASASSLPAPNVARWNGSAWSSVGGGTNGAVTDLEVFDDGTGEGAELVATGILTAAGSTPAAYVAAWRANAWHALGAGLSPMYSTGRALGVTESGGASDLYVAGDFDAAGGAPSIDFARWRGCGQTGELACFGDGSGSACPCGNTSAPASRSGCLNSFGTGAALRASGGASLAADTLALRADGLPPTAPTLFFQGTATIAGGAAFGDGLRCAGGQIARLGVRSASGGIASAGHGSPGAPLHEAGQVHSPGVSRTYQAWYRNGASFCTASTFNLSNAVRISWVP